MFRAVSKLVQLQTRVRLLRSSASKFSPATRDWKLISVAHEGNLNENNKAFGRAQSFVPGSAPDWYLQFMVKDSKKYATTRGWGYAQFDKDGNPSADEAKL